jgi:signal transduction histidine kinase
VSQQVRQEIARDLHDGFAQELTLIGYEIDSLIATNTDVDLRADLRQLRFQISSLLDRTRQELFSLHKISAEPFEVRLAALIDELRFPFQPSLSIDTSLLAHGNQEELFAILRELLTNLYKHGNPTQLAISLEPTTTGWELSFASDGSEEMSIKPGHFGFIGIQERCAKLKADFNQEMRDDLLLTFITKVNR